MCPQKRPCSRKCMCDWPNLPAKLFGRSSISSTNPLGGKGLRGCSNVAVLCNHAFRTDCLSKLFWAYVILCFFLCREHKYSVRLSHASVTHLLKHLKVCSPGSCGGTHSHASVTTYPLKQLKVCSPGSCGGYYIHASVSTYLLKQLKVCSPGSNGGYYIHASVTTYPLKQLKVCSPGSNGGYYLHASVTAYLLRQLKVCSPGSNDGYYMHLSLLTFLDS